MSTQKVKNKNLKKEIVDKIYKAIEDKTFVEVYHVPASQNEFQEHTDRAKIEKFVDGLIPFIKGRVYIEIPK